MQDYLVEVLRKNYLAANILELSVKLIKPRSIKFKPGQFVFFKVGGAFKAYTIISLPGDKHRLRFLIKLVPRGVASGFIHKLQVGDRFEISGPEGYFTVNARRSNICLVSFGIGVAPFLSIIPALLEKKYPGRISYVRVHNKETKSFYDEQFKQLEGEHANFEYLPMLSAASEVTSYLKEKYEKFQSYKLYICGSKQVIESTNQTLAGSKYRVEQLIYESFF